VPIVVTGFEPLDVLEGIRRAIIQLEAGRAEVENAYERAVTYEGNAPAQKLLEQVFEVCDRNWRGIGTIPQSGWRLRAEYGDFDAAAKFNVMDIQTEESALCHSGDVLTGRIKTAPMPRLRHHLHAAQPAWRDDGQQRRRLRRILSVQANCS